MGINEAYGDMVEQIHGEERGDHEALVNHALDLVIAYMNTNNKEN